VKKDTIDPHNIYIFQKIDKIDPMFLYQVHPNFLYWFSIIDFYYATKSNLKHFQIHHTYPLQEQSENLIQVFDKEIKNKQNSF